MHTTHRRRFRADDPERMQWQDAEKILDAIGVTAGMVFFDIGCGEGYFALPAARRVGANGKVHASDINPDAITALRINAAEEGLKNITAEATAAEDSVPCEGCADIVFLGNNLHDFADPEKVLRNATTILKPSGRLADLDWKDIRTDPGPPFEKRFPAAKAQRMIVSAGLRVLSVQDAGPYHYLILAAP